MNELFIIEKLRTLPPEKVEEALEYLRVLLKTQETDAGSPHSENEKN